MKCNDLGSIIQEVIVFTSVSAEVMNQEIKWREQE